MLLFTVTQIVKVLSSILNTAMEIPLSTSKKNTVYRFSGIPYHGPLAQLVRAGGS